MGVPHAEAVTKAAQLSEANSSSSALPASGIPHFFELDFAYATRSVLYAMAIVMAAAAVVAVVGLQAGRQEMPEPDTETAVDTPTGADTPVGADAPAEADGPTG